MDLLKKYKNVVILKPLKAIYNISKLLEEKLYQKKHNVKIKKEFKYIYKTNFWKNSESASGYGSTIKYTKHLIEELLKIIKEKEIKIMVDIPCGDFNWMKNMDLSTVNYIGGDIVDDIIKKNIKKYETKTIKFKVINIITDPLPVGDLIFVRDCFVHLSYKDILKSIENIKKTGYKYLLTTTFPDHSNSDIINSLGWRPLNFQDEPFNFPKPEYIILENNETEYNEILGNDSKLHAEFKDKSMGFWDIKKILNHK